MNIFVLSKSPRYSARWQCDKHVVKMPTETGQMLSTALFINGTDGYWKPSYQKHPCTIWASQTSANFEWLVQHGIELCNEYQRRYGREHGALKAILHAQRMKGVIPKGKLTKFPLAMPEQHKNPNSIVSSYRLYYHIDKRSFATWRNNKPDWFEQL